MKMALLEAKKAYCEDEIPVGCVIVHKNEIIACGYHAEIVAIEAACGKLGSWRLDDCDLYVTLEPCMMCLGAIIEARIKNVYFGTKNNSKQMYDKIRVKSFVNLIFVNSGSCSKILSDFFVNKRKK